MIYADELRKMIDLHSKTHTSDVPNAIRDALIYAPDPLDADIWTITTNEHETINYLVSHAFALAETDRTERHFLTELLLNLSLCPIHRCDYAICFDDENDECAVIRTYFPLHDT
jgi:hypothetical protein